MYRSPYRADTRAGELEVGVIKVLNLPRGVMEARTRATTASSIQGVHISALLALHIQTTPLNLLFRHNGFHLGRFASYESDSRLCCGNPPPLRDGWGGTGMDSTFGDRSTPFVSPLPADSPPHFRRRLFLSHWRSLTNRNGIGKTILSAE